MGDKKLANCRCAYKSADSCVYAPFHVGYESLDCTKTTLFQHQEANMPLIAVDYNLEVEYHIML